ncbi:MAG TPA: hypothetical protein PK961_12915 [bacterium]|nr:hypothetical protein [bacterium]
MKSPRRIHFLLFFLIFGLVACDCADRKNPTGEFGDLDDEFRENLLAPSPILRWLLPPPDINVTERLRLGEKWSCADPNSCTGDYLAFLELAAMYSRPESKQDLIEQFDDYRAMPPYADPLPADELRRRIVEILNIDFLLDGLLERPLDVSIVEVRRFDDYDEFRLLFHDPWVGSFEALLLQPIAVHPRGAILAVHGHFQTARSFRQDHPFRDFIDQGWAVLLPTMRIDNADQHEDEISRRFLSDGFTLLGVRIYEILLARKYLLSKYGERSPVGFLGHSGGSVAGSVAIRLEPGFSVFVFDCVGWYLYYGYNDDSLADEIVPRLHPLAARINDYSTVAMPQLFVPYAYEGQWSAILDFFQDHM